MNVRNKRKIKTNSEQLQLEPAYRVVISLTTPWYIVPALYIIPFVDWHNYKIFLKNVYILRPCSHLRVHSVRSAGERKEFSQTCEGWNSTGEDRD